MSAYECDNDDHPVGCRCPGRTPDFTHLLLRDLTGYLIGRGFPKVEAEKRAAELLVLVRNRARSITVSPEIAPDPCPDEWDTDED